MTTRREFATALLLFTASAVVPLAASTATHSPVPAAGTDRDGAEFFELEGNRHWGCARLAATAEDCLARALEA